MPTQGDMLNKSVRAKCRWSMAAIYLLAGVHVEATHDPRTGGRSTHVRQRMTLQQDDVPHTHSAGSQTLQTRGHGRGGHWRPGPRISHADKHNTAPESASSIPGQPVRREEKCSGGAAHGIGQTDRRRARSALLIASRQTVATVWGRRAPSRRREGVRARHRGGTEARRSGGSASPGGAR